MLTIRAAALAACLPVAAEAATVLTVDLTVANRITITATDADASGTVSGDPFTGVLLAGFYGSTTGTNFVEFSTGAADLTSAGNANAGGAGLYREGTGDGVTPDLSSVGLNVFNYTFEATSDFVAGSRAFAGTATWSLTTAQYQEALAGNSSGTVYAFAEDDSMIPGATVIGEWVLAAAVPLPAAGWLLVGALAGLGAVARRRA